MRKPLLFALLLASAFQTALGAVEGQWTYIVENGGATITASTATGAVTIPSVLGGYAVKNVGKSYPPIFGWSNTSVSSITIPNSVTSIGGGAFSGCKSLTTLTIGSGVTSIEGGAFEGCSGLTTLTIPNSVTSIFGGAFSYCTGLTTLTIGSGVTSLGGYAFTYCTGLTTLTIPNNVTNIGTSAFEGCSGLTTLTIPNSVTNIWDRAFFQCTGLATLTIPNSVTSIGVQAFSGCSGLTTLTIPNSVTSIGGGAFGSCIKLVTVYLPARFSGTYPSLGLTAEQVYFATTATLTASCNSSEGTILVNPNKSPYDVGESAVVTASPKAGYLFSNWSGDSTATTSSITLTMDANKSVTATFTQDGRDADGDGLTNYQESITYGTNPNQKDTNSDGIEDGQAVTLGYNPSLSFSALISHLQNHPPTGLYNAGQMQAMAIGDLVLTKNVNGSFTLNYDIEQSADLQTWTRYQALSLPLTGLPTDKAFVRIKAKH